MYKDRSCYCTYCILDEQQQRFLHRERATMLLRDAVRRWFFDVSCAPLQNLHSHAHGVGFSGSLQQICSWGRRHAQEEKLRVEGARVDSSISEFDSWRRKTYREAQYSFDIWKMEGIQGGLGQPAGDAGDDDQIAQLKAYLKTIMAKQEELKKVLEVKHNKAANARRLSSQGGESLRNVMLERDDASHSVDVVNTPNVKNKLEEYSHNVEELEKELEETTKLVNEVATALAYMSGGTS